MSLSAQDLVGGWTFVEWSIALPDGKTSRPFQPDPSGMVVYSADGMMSAVIQAGDRRPFADANIRRLSSQIKAEAFDSYFHYAGTWSIRDNSVVHVVTASLNPNFLGTEQVRFVHLADGTLTLSADELITGRYTRHHRLVWRRHEVK